MVATKDFLSKLNQSPNKSSCPICYSCCSSC